MKQYIKTTPLEGIEIKMGEKIHNIVFGWTKEQLISAIGAPKRPTETSLTYWGSSLRFDFEDDKLVFIEFLGGIDGPFQPAVYGNPVFEMEADDVVAMFRKRDSDISDEEKGHCITFKGISVGLYRENTPESVSENIREYAAMGHPMSAEAIMAEKRQAAHWDTFGIGKEGYYKQDTQ